MSYTNNPLSILGGTGIVVTPTTGTGANSVTISTSGAQTLAVTIASATPFGVINTDDVVSVEVTPAVPVAVNLPAGVLASVATPITVTPLVGTIDGAATAVINVPYGSLQIIYSGVEWKII